jgi:hypothetical protein
MKQSNMSNRSDIENNISSAISAYLSGECSSLRKAAAAFKAPFSTIQARMAGRNSRAIARETQQTITNTEETTLVRWITRLTRTGFPAAPKLTLEMTEDIRRGRVQLSGQSAIIGRPIGCSWLDRFKSRHPVIAGVWTRQVEAGDSTELILRHQYPADRI